MIRQGLRCPACGEEKIDVEITHEWSGMAITYPDWPIHTFVILKCLDCAFTNKCGVQTNNPQLPKSVLPWLKGE